MIIVINKLSNYPETHPQSYLKRRLAMALEICWLDDLTKAQETARTLNKPIFLDFYNPQ
jgi:hypothetical protein